MGYGTAERLLRRKMDNQGWTCVPHSMATTVMATLETKMLVRDDYIRLEHHKYGPGSMLNYTKQFVMSQHYWQQTQLNATSGTSFKLSCTIPNDLNPTTHATGTSGFDVNLSFTVQSDSKLPMR